MDGYIADVRTRFNHPNPRKPQHSPHKHRHIIYGAKSQLITNEVNYSPLLDAKGVKHVQSVVGDDPVRIHTLRKYIGQTEDMTGVELVKAKQ